MYSSFFQISAKHRDALPPVHTRRVGVQYVVLYTLHTTGLRIPASEQLRGGAKDQGIFLLFFNFHRTFFRRFVGRYGVQIETWRGPRRDRTHVLSRISPDVCPPHLQRCMVANKERHLHKFAQDGLCLIFTSGRVIALWSLSPSL